MTILALLLRVAVIYLIVRLVWKAFARPRPTPRPRPTEGQDTALGADIVDAEWVDLEE